MNSLIKSAIIIDKKSDFHNSKVDILIENNIITNIGKNLKNPKNYKEISFNNLHVSKGWFDYSVCFGEPGYEERETILNGIKVASRSGFTSIGLQPNTSPVIEKKTEIVFNTVPYEAYFLFNMKHISSISMLLWYCIYIWILSCCFMHFSSCI